MDLYFWSLLRNHSFHSFLSQLPYLVFPRSWDDHLYGLVLGNSCLCSWSGKEKKEELKTNKLTAIVFLNMQCFFSSPYKWFFFCWSGWRCYAQRSKKVSALLHRSHQHSLHLWWACCDCVSFFPPSKLIRIILDFTLFPFFLFLLLLHGFSLQLLPAILGFETQTKSCKLNYFCLLRNQH